MLENSNPFTIDGVTISGGTAGDCIIQFPQVDQLVTDYRVVSVMCNEIVCPTIFSFIGQRSLKRVQNPARFDLDFQKFDAAVCTFPFRHT